MGGRLETIASNEELYASALIREVMEAFVVTRESGYSNESGESDSLEERLRRELIGLNENLIQISERRDKVQGELVRQSRKREAGHADGDEGASDDDLKDEGSDDEDFGFGAEPIE